MPICDTREWREYARMRKGLKKPLTAHAAALAVAKLARLAPGDEAMQRRILDQSTFYCWQGLFALKEPRGVQGAPAGVGGADRVAREPGWAARAAGITADGVLTGSASSGVGQAIREPCAGVGAALPGAGGVRALRGGDNPFARLAVAL